MCEKHAAGAIFGDGIAAPETLIAIAAILIAGFLTYAIYRFARIR